MNQHVSELLGAYHDGELNPNRQQQVEKHLMICDECRAQLEQMRNLSALLHEPISANRFISTERFVSNLTLKLPRHPAQSQTRKALEIGWWLIPLGALGVWLFLQITFSLSTVVSTLSETGLLGNGLSWLQASAPQARWFSVATNLFGGQIGPNSKFVLSVLNELSVFIQNLTNLYIWQVLFATLYLGWLISWWLRQPNQVTSVNSAPQS